jgi:DNA polymerase
VGRSGEFLNEYLEKCGIKRNDCYITNTVKCHTFGNREPDILEITTCIKLWLNREIIYLQPKIIFILGADAYRGVFKIGLSPWMKNTGVVRDLRKEYGFRTVILPHPSAIISYAPHWKSKYDDTVEQVKAIIKEENL